MNYRKKLLPMLCCTALMTGCATNQPANSNDNALKIEPSISVGGASNSAASMYQLGRYYQGQNRYDQAITAYKKSLAADASAAEAHNGLGVVYSRIGKFDDAISEFNAALEKSPQAAHIHNNLGYAYYLQGQYNESISELKQALELDPNNKRALKNLSLAYEKSGGSDPSVQAMLDRQSAADSASAATMGSKQDSWELKPAGKKGSAQEDSGRIIRASNSQVEIVQIAPAVYQLQRHEAAQPVQPVKAQMPVPKNIGIEIANGNGVTGMAKRVGIFLRHEGYPAARLTNQKPFRVKESQVQYRPGYQQAAEQLQANIPGKPKLVERKDLRLGINLRLVLGKDLVDDQAAFKVK